MKYNKDGSVTKPHGVKRKDLTGQIFGELRVVERLECGPKKVKWLCECTITGQTRNVLMCDLLSGKVTTRSNKHGLSKHALYETWEQVVQRCTNKRHGSYHNYGGRGITLCPTWRDFSQFLRDMGERPEGMTLDRKDNNKNYCKSNCRWLSFKDQQNNKRTNVVVMYGGTKYTLTTFSEKYNMKRRQVEYCIQKSKLTPRQTISKLGGHL